MPSHYNDGEYKGSEHASDVFQAPTPELTEEEKKQKRNMEKGQYIDIGELDQQGEPLKASTSDILSDINRQKQLRDAEKNKGFDKEMQAIGKAKAAGNLTDQEIIDAHKRAGDIRNKEEQMNTLQKKTGFGYKYLEGMLNNVNIFASDMKDILSNIDLSKTWDSAKTVDNWYNPFEVGSAAAAHTAEFVLPQTQEELMLELMTLGQGKKLSLGRKLAWALLKDTPAYQKATSLFNSLKVAATGGLEVGTARNVSGNRPRIGQRSQMSDDVLPSGIGKEIPDAFTPSLDPSGPKPWFQKGKRREISSELTTGKKVTPDVIKEFNDEGATAAKAIEAKLNIPLGETDIHHIGWIRQIFESMNGLTKEFRLKSTKYYERSLGIELGYSRKNATPLPKLFHPRLHALVNKRIGGGEGVFNLTRLEKKFNLPKDWKKTTEYGQRLKIYREVVNTIGHSVKHIDHFWNGLKSRTNQLGKLNKEQYMKTVFDLLELDEKLLDLKHIPLMRAKPGVNTASDIINDILSNANKVDLSLPKFSKLSVTDLNAVAKVEIINQQILREALLSKQSANTVFEAYKDVIGISRRQFNNILNQIDPNKLMQKGMSIEDVDTYLRSGWGDPTKAKSSLKPLTELGRTDYTTKELVDMGYSITDIETARNAGWNVLDLD